MNRARRDERGQGILEFAIIFPFFMMLVFVVIDGGVLMGRYNQVNHAAQEGARFGATGADRDDIVSRVRAQSIDLLTASDVPTQSGDCGNASQPGICVLWFSGPNSEPRGQVGSSVMVIVRYDYEWVTPLGGDFLGATLIPDELEVSSCALARLERPAQVTGPSSPARQTC